MARIVQLARAMLGERDRAFVFQRYLETVLPEDSARTRLLHAAMAQETPEASLFVLRHGFTNLIEVGERRCSRLPRVNFRLFYAHARDGDARDRAERVLQPARRARVPARVRSHHRRRRCSS